MKALIATVSCLVLASVALAQQPPKGMPPTLRVVLHLDKDKGQLVIGESIVRHVPVTVQRNVIKDGQNVVETVTEITTVVEERLIMIDVANSRAITPDGKQLPIDEVWTRVKKYSVIALSADGNTPASEYLRALNNNTLVIIPGMAIKK